MYRNGHVPYRDTKITHLLKKELTFTYSDAPLSYLDGASSNTPAFRSRINTIMICLISPRTIEESISTLRFGHQCRGCGMHRQNRLTFLMCLYGCGFLTLGGHSNSTVGASVDVQAGDAVEVRGDERLGMSVVTDDLHTTAIDAKGKHPPHIRTLYEIFCNMDLVRFIAFYL